VLLGAAWWSGLGGRIVQRVTEHTGFALGALLALVPFALHGLCVWLGLIPFVHSLPIWIRAPWDIGVNLHDGGQALGTLLGCAPEGTASVLIGQGVEAPPHRWPLLTEVLAWAAPLEVGWVGFLIAAVAWRDRRAWQRLWRLRGQEPTPPTVLALLGLAVAAGLYLLQATSPNASSIRYLVPTWIFLPGLLAAGWRALPGPGRWTMGLLLLVPWAGAQANLWADLDRVFPLRPLADALDRSGVPGIVAETPIALMVANLTHGRVGALEYRARWPRLNDRYADRFVAGAPVTCVHDVTLSWHPGEDRQGVLLKRFGQRLEELARHYPGRVRRRRVIGQFEVWEVDLPLAEIFDADARPFPLTSGPASR
jgi:hypothetical protein